MKSKSDNHPMPEPMDKHIGERKHAVKSDMAWKKSSETRCNMGKPLPGRLELPTLRLTASRSNQLS